MNEIKINKNDRINCAKIISEINFSLFPRNPIKIKFSTFKKTICSLKGH